MSLKQFFGFVVVGSIATLVHYTTLILLVESQLLKPIPASLAGFVLGGITGFTLNRQFVFRHTQSQSTALCKYFLLATTSAGINTSIMSLMIHTFHFHYLLAQVCATGSVVLWNFTCCRIWVFKEN